MVNCLGPFSLRWCLSGLNQEHPCKDNPPTMTTPTPSSTPSGWCLVIHGGAGSMTPENLPPEQAEPYSAGLAKALAQGVAVLAAGGTALDAVEASVGALEDDPLFNAGRGAVFTAEGRIELDAAIMDGTSRAARSVAGVTRTRHPVSLARAVMERSPHVLLAREGADIFAIEQGLEQTEPGWFRTDARWQALEAMKAAAARGEALFDADLKFGTVGAVARDNAGHLAAATSTGGLTGKRWGRVGDSPLIGAGTLADDRACAVSATGAGEVFIRASAAHEISARIRLGGKTAKMAAEAVIRDDIGELGGTGGVIYIGADGGFGWAFNTPGMFRAKASAATPAQVAIFAEQK